MATMGIRKIENSDYEVKLNIPPRELEYLFNCFAAGTECGFLLTQDFSLPLAEQLRQYIINAQNTGEL